MANEKRLIYLEDVLEEIDDAISNIAYTSPYQNDISTTVSGMERVRDIVEDAPTVDAVEVVHGRWEKCGGDLHSSGYAVYCSVCNKAHFVHNEYSLGGLYGHKELFELPNYCPNCGAKMDGDGNG